MSVKNNKVYNDVLIAIDKCITISGYTTLYSSLVKIYHNTEDEILQGYILNYTELIKHIPPYNKAKLISKTRELIQSSKEHKDILYKYCNSVIMSGKPEWQVIAERNGWKPVC